MRSTYTPSPGSYGAAALAHLQAAYPNPVSGTQLAELLGIESKNVMPAVRGAIEHGMVTSERIGNRNLYRSVGEASNQWPLSMEELNLLARRAIGLLSGATRSSVDLAGACNATKADIDTALDPLVQARKLIRVDVMRGGQPMFDYRYGAAWVPRDADFDQGAGSPVPAPKVSPVAAPAPAPAPVPVPAPAPAPAPEAKVTNPASPWRKPNHLQLPGSPVLAERVQPAQAPGPVAPAPAPAEKPAPKEPTAKPAADALASGAELGKKTRAPVVPVFTSPKNLGWKIGQPAVEPSVRDAIASGQETMPGCLEADDLVCAINSRGELVLDLGGDEIVKFPPVQALYLKRFLDNTSVLEELAAQGSL
jgi:hypothetical protein